MYSIKHIKLQCVRETQLFRRETQHQLNYKKMITEKRKEIAKAAKMFYSNVLAGAFNTKEIAIKSSYRTIKLSMVMAVEDEYWVVTPAEAQRLNKLGYEYTK